MHALVTGGAGFIGSHLVDFLLSEGWAVTSIDSLDDFYDPNLKRSYISGQREHRGFRFLEIDVRDEAMLDRELREDYDVIIHLAAKAGVRPSIQNPMLYQDVNIRGTQTLLEFAKNRSIQQFIFASSSSVYGVNPNVPWRESDSVLLPISPYASTKVSGEMLGHVYSHLYGIRFVALRFFTVFGPRQRPDLAIHKFVRLLLKGVELPVYGDGKSRRDYTYVSDIVRGVRSAMSYTSSRYEVINLGNGSAVTLIELLSGLTEVSGITPRLAFLPPQAGDVPQTLADITKARSLLGYKPETDLLTGLRCCLKWVESLDLAEDVATASAAIH